MILYGHKQEALILKVYFVRLHTAKQWIPVSLTINKIKILRRSIKRYLHKDGK